MGKPPVSIAGRYKTTNYEAAVEDAMMKELERLGCNESDFSSIRRKRGYDQRVI